MSSDGGYDIGDGDDDDAKDDQYITVGIQSEATFAITLK